MTNRPRCGLLSAQAWSLLSIPVSGSSAESGKDGRSKNRLALRHSNCRIPSHPDRPLPCGLNCIGTAPAMLWFAKAVPARRCDVPLTYAFARIADDLPRDAPGL
jgi:hypothetical protein